MSRLSIAGLLFGGKQPRGKTPDTLSEPPSDNTTLLNGSSESQNRHSSLPHPSVGRAKRPYMARRSLDLSYAKANGHTNNIASTKQNRHVNGIPNGTFNGKVANVGRTDLDSNNTSHNESHQGRSHTNGHGLHTHTDFSGASWKKHWFPGIRK